MNDLWREVIIAVLAFASAYGLWYVKDRKKSRAEAAVAEGTIGSDIDLREIARDTASVVLLEKAFQMERTSNEREIAKLTLKVETLERTSNERGVKVQQLEMENAELRAEVAQLHARLDKLDPNGEAVPT